MWPYCLPPWGAVRPRSAPVGPGVFTCPCAGTSGPAPRDIALIRRASAARHRPCSSLDLNRRANFCHGSRESSTGSSTETGRPSPLGDSSMDESSYGEERAPFSAAAVVMVAAGNPAASSPPASRGESGDHRSRSARVFGPSKATTASAVVFSALDAAV